MKVFLVLLVSCLHRLSHQSKLNVFEYSGNTLSLREVESEEQPTRLLSINYYLPTEDEIVFNKSSIENIYITSHKFTKIKEKTFDDFAKLRTLNLEGNEIGSLPKDIFIKTPMLDDLSLFYNKIHNLDFSAPKITTLDVTKNLLKDISNDYFSKIANVVNLILDENLIDNVEPMAFKGLSKLTILKMRKNRISTLSADVFEFTPSLAELYLDYNRLQAVNQNWFSKLHNLEKLSLSFNKISTIPLTSFHSLKSLRILNLNDNKLTSLHADIVKNLHNLTKLYLDGNNLETLSPDMFSTLARLHKLQLNRNLIIALPDGLFSKLKDLHILDLSYNNIVELPTNFAIGLENLLTLSLTKNKAMKIIQGAFTPLNKLTHVGLPSIDNNHLERLHELPSLKTVAVVGAKLNNLSVGNISFAKNSGNQWKVIRS